MNIFASLFIVIFAKTRIVYIFFLKSTDLVRNCGRARARPQTNLAFGGQRHVLKAYSASADLKENFGTFLAFLCSSNWNEWYVNKRRSKDPGVEFKLRDMGHVFHVNISKCSFPTHMSRPAFTRPSNKTFISFEERLLYGVISPPKFKVCFRCSSLSFNHATFEFYNTTLLLEMRHWSFTMTHRSSVIQHSSFNIQHSSLFQHSSFKLNFTDEWLTF